MYIKATYKGKAGDRLPYLKEARSVRLIVSDDKVAVYVSNRQGSETRIQYSNFDEFLKDWGVTPPNVRVIYADDPKTFKVMVPYGIVDSRRADRLIEEAKHELARLAKGCIRIEDDTEHKRLYLTLVAHDLSNSNREQPQGDKMAKQTNDLGPNTGPA